MRIACVQCNVAFSDPIKNAGYAAKKINELADQGVELAVFPEAFLTGYCVDSAEGAGEIAIAADHEALAAIQAACDETGVLAVAGFAERDGERLYNTAALFEPTEPVRFYRKTHLPCLGLDRFVEPGASLPVFDTRLGRVGVLICYDLRPPEAARTLVLKGAEIIVLPTNWPEGAEVSADHIGIARAAESRVFVATCNRAGRENGFRFIGRSRIIHPTGRVLAVAGDDETVILADIDLDDARQKRTVNIPGKYEVDVIACRRPELYGPLTGNL